MLVGLMSGTVTVVFWALFPSFGPSAWLQVDAITEQAINLATPAAYGQELQRLAAEGSEIIRFSQILGVVAFPSYHTVLACMVVFFTWGLRYRMVFVAANLFMMPAILSHGGHHVIDVVGGLAVFILCIVPAKPPP